MSGDPNRETARLWRVRRTVHEMVRDRVRRNERCDRNG